MQSTGGTRQCSLTSRKEGRKLQASKIRSEKQGLEQHVGEFGHYLMSNRHWRLLSKAQCWSRKRWLRTKYVEVVRMNYRLEETTGTTGSGSEAPLSGLGSRYYEPGLE